MEWGDAFTLAARSNAWYLILAGITFLKCCNSELIRIRLSIHKWVTLTLGVSTGKIQHQRRGEGPRSAFLQR